MKKSVFLSYSKKDFFFAEMLDLKLKATTEFEIWRDLDSIRAGDDWRKSIEDGIREAYAVVTALSSHSAASPYVTYEWAYALGMGKPHLTVKLEESEMHPRIETSQYLDFSYPKALPWDNLIRWLGEIEKEVVEDEPNGAAAPEAQPGVDTDQLGRHVLRYLNRKGFTMASFERLRERLELPKAPSDEDFEALIQHRPSVFRKARLKGDKPGIAKRVP